jgi:hypothetical protein
MRPALLLAMCLALPAQAAVEVNFVHPERYTDAGFGAVETQRTCTEIAQHLDRLGQRYLGAGQDLRIEVLDIDLAGRPHIGVGDFRVMRSSGADWPRMRVRYVLEAAGAAPVRGEELIVDQDYLRWPLRTPESLGYEKRMLNEWFRLRFGETTAQRLP